MEARPNLTYTIISKPYMTRWDFSEPYFIKEFRRVPPTFKMEFSAPPYAVLGLAYKERHAARGLRRNSICQIAISLWHIKRFGSPLCFPIAHFWSRSLADVFVAGGIGR